MGGMRCLAACVVSRVLLPNVTWEHYQYCESLIGETLDSPNDVVRLHKKVLCNGLDIQQIHHAYSSADIALWDIVGQKLGEPIYRLLDPQSQSHSKLPYTSVLFGDTSEETYQIATQLRGQGYRATKFGWGPMGKFGEENDWSIRLKVLSFLNT